MMLCLRSTISRPTAVAAATFSRVVSAPQQPPLRAIRSFASYSLSDLKDLRARTGAPMVECKKALEHAVKEESSVDLQTLAMDWLREHGAAKASSKVQGRETTEGLVGMALSKEKGCLVKVSAETDFAGRSSTFVQLVLDVSKQVLLLDNNNNDKKNNELDVDTLIQQTEVKSLLDKAIVSIRENLSIASATHITASSSDDSILVGYVHNRLEQSNAGSAAAIVELSSSGKNTVDTTELEQVGKQLAMHIVAARPEYMTPDDIPDNVVQHEKDLIMKQITADNEKRDKKQKPEVMEKIVQGRLRKFLFETYCLTKQSHYIEEGNPVVEQVLKDKGIILHQFVVSSIVS